jgi:branched-chain amino acid transport system substrate-binding protein
MVLCLLVGACSSSSESSKSSKSSSRPSITIGLITSLTGPGASNSAGTVPAAEARIDVQNAQGGIDGRQIKLIVEDDQTSPAGNQLASNLLVSKGVFGVIDESGVVFAGSKVLQAAGVPVTGGGFDGPEWGEQPNTNMFSVSGSFDPKDPQSSGLAQFVKAHGGTTCGSLGYGIIPSSRAAASGFLFSCSAEGLKKAYLNTSVPLTDVSIVPLALQIKTAGPDALYLPLAESTNLAILQAVKQAGFTPKVAISATGYSQALLNDKSTVQDAQGVYFETPGTPVELKTPATTAFQAALAQYAHYSGVPGYDWYQGWASTDLMLYGLKLAGKNPTRAGFINALHNVTNYNVGGLEPSVNLTLTQFGKTASPICIPLVKLQGDAFVDPTTACGPVLANSDQLPSA